MSKPGSIVTVGLCPSWDRVCEFDGIEWGEHKLVSASHIRPAGKAMNISQALAWMGQKSIAAGLWGEDDYALLMRATQPLKRFISVKVTPVEGGTRQNVTIVDTRNHREMHLRHRCDLASVDALKRLRTDLERIVKKNSVCAFAGLMPGRKYLDNIIRMIEFCTERGAGVVVDTSGPAIKEILDTGRVWMIKPNVEEMRELMGKDIPNRPLSLARAGRNLLDRVKVVLISRGAKGAVVVTRDGAWQGKCTKTRKVLATVGCGDYMLAGFLNGTKNTSNVGAALATAIKAGTAMAWGCTHTHSWEQVCRRTTVKVDRI